VGSRATMLKRFPRALLAISTQSLYHGGVAPQQQPLAVPLHRYTA
jgi:hypothetical protein